MSLLRTSPRPIVLLLALAVLLFGALGGLVLAASGEGAPTAGELRNQIGEQRQQESKLRGTAERLEAIEQQAAAAAAAGQRRLDEAQAGLVDARRRLEQSSGELRDTRARLVRLRARLARARAALASVLRARYVDDPPGLADVVVQADGFQDLLERVEFLRHVRDRDADVVVAVRRARKVAVSDEARLTRLRLAHRRQTAEAQRQRDGIATMAAGLEARRAEAARAASARRQALRDSRAGRRRAEGELERLLAAERRRAQQYTAPSGGAGARASGGWAIPWAIVQCESGGVNHRPNSAGASGYYQFMPQTWRGLGGSTAHAYQASRAEQDRLAARLWAGGAGASNWDCAAMVGVTG